MLVVEVRELLADCDQPQRVVPRAAHKIVEPAASRGALDQLPCLVDDEEAPTRPCVLDAVAGKVLVAGARDAALDVLADYEQGRRGLCVRDRARVEDD